MRLLKRSEAMVLSEPLINSARVSRKPWSRPTRGVRYTPTHCSTTSPEGQHAPNRLCQQSELLFAIRKAGRLRHDVPVHVTIALLAAQAQHVQPFGRHAAPKRFADPMHPAL
jgi:hypothetical protein